MKLTFLGLGVMGFPMAGHLASRGFSVTVYNRTPERSLQWLEKYQGERNSQRISRALTVSEACEQADVIFSCLGNDDDVREVMLGEQGVASVIKPHALVCDHTTTSAKLARELYEAFSGLNAEFLDAPVSGGEVGAQNGKLSIMLGGNEDAFKRIEEVLRSYASTLSYIGESGSGQLAKMVNQICICGILQGLSEALHFGECANLDMHKVLSAISGGAAQSWQMNNRAETMLERSFDFGFAVDWMKKDLAFVLTEAENLGIDLPLVKQVDAYYSEVQSMGGRRWDTSSLMARYKKP